MISIFGDYIIIIYSWKDGFDIKYQELCDSILISLIRRKESVWNLASTRGKLRYVSISDIKQE